MNLFNIRFKSGEKDTENPYTLWELAELYGFPFKFIYKPEYIVGKLAKYDIYTAVGISDNGKYILDNSTTVSSSRIHWNGITKEFYLIED